MNGDFVQQQDAVRRQERPDVFQRVAQVARCMQYVGSDDEIDAVRGQTLLGRVAFDVEHAAADERVVFESIFSAPQEELR